VTKALLDNGIRIASVDDYSVPQLLYVRLNSMHFDSGNLCVSHVAVQLYLNLYAAPGHNPTGVFGKFVLAHRGSLLSSARSRHGQRIRDAVFGYVEEIALAIRVANQ